eukprot:TRINITY_DN3098_c0_g1_i3.p1 TRINITY_DN3098_c0_g1~~TRINITY_DN3098_c0_g1_i3.p1  ORF type:complete len:299 (-),score=79.57 TRINITY_DN3098_c0_g1_i3:41-937(-)
MRISQLEAERENVYIPEDESEITAAIKQAEEDEALAYMLQEQEKLALNNYQQSSLSKELTPLQYKYYKMQFNEKDTEISEEFQNFYDAVEPRYSDDEDEFYIFDDAQRREDIEIAHVSKTDFSKRMNSIPTALHHKDFKVTRKGKQKSSGYREHIYIEADHTKNRYYGNVVNLPGCGYAKVFIPQLSIYPLDCRIAGKLRHNYSSIEKGGTVLVDVREYQKYKGDIIYAYNNEEIIQLNLDSHDMCEELPLDVLRLISEHFDDNQKLRCLTRVNKKWYDIFLGESLKHKINLERMLSY